MNGSHNHFHHFDSYTFCAHSLLNRYFVIAPFFSVQQQPVSDARIHLTKHTRLFSARNLFQIFFSTASFLMLIRVLFGERACFRFFTRALMKGGIYFQNLRNGRGKSAFFRFGVFEKMSPLFFCRFVSRWGHFGWRLFGLIMNVCVFFLYVLIRSCRIYGVLSVWRFCWIFMLWNDWVYMR